MREHTKVWNRDFLVAFVINIFTALGFHILTPTLPKYAVTLGYSAAAAGAIGTAFTITAIVARFFSAALATPRRMKRILMLALGIITTASLCYAVFPQMGMLLAARLLHGVGWGLATTITATLAVQVLPQDQIGKGIGLFGLASVIGQAAAPNLGLTLIGYVGYPMTFVLAACFSCAALVECTAICSTQVKTDTTAEVPVKRMLFTREALFPALLMGIVTMAVSSVSYFLAMHADKQGIENVGSFFTIYAFSLFLIRPLFGSIADRADKRLVFIPVSLTMIASLLLISGATSLALLLVVAVLYGLSYGGIQPTVHAWCIEVTPPEQYAYANSTFYSFFDIGMCIGSVAGGVIADAAGYAAMYRIMCIPVAVAALLALADYIWVKRTARKLA